MAGLSVLQQNLARFTGDVLENGCVIDLQLKLTQV